MTNGNQGLRGVEVGQELPVLLDYAGRLDGFFRTVTKITALYVICDTQYKYRKSDGKRVSTAPSVTERAYDPKTFYGEQQIDEVNRRKNETIRRHLATMITPMIHHATLDQLTEIQRILRKKD